MHVKRFLWRVDLECVGQAGERAGDSRVRECACFVNTHFSKLDDVLGPEAAGGEFRPVHERIAEQEEVPRFDLLTAHLLQDA